MGDQTKGRESADKRIKPNSRGTRGSRRRPRPARSGGRGANDRFVGRRGQEGASTTHADHPPVQACGRREDCGEGRWSAAAAYQDPRRARDQHKLDHGVKREASAANTSGGLRAPHPGRVRRPVGSGPFAVVKKRERGTRSEIGSEAQHSTKKRDQFTRSAVGEIITTRHGIPRATCWRIQGCCRSSPH